MEITNNIAFKQTSNLKICKKSKKYALRHIEPSNRLIGGILLVFLLVLIYFIGFVCEYKWEKADMSMAIRMVSSFFDFSKTSGDTFLTIVISLVNTIVLALTTTIVSSIIAFFLGLMASRNFSTPLVSNIIKSISSFVRAVPTIIWVLLFISGFGLTATTAIVGMMFHSVAYFVKSYSESFEEIDEGIIEALKASGASYWQIVFNALLPLTFTKLISWIAMRSEMNFAAAVIIGPAVGVPGTIGSILNQYARNGNYSTMGICIILIFLTTIIFEIFVTNYKQKSIIN